MPRLRVDPALLYDAQQVFSKYAGEAVSDRDTDEMLANLTRFTLVLERWKREELQEKATRAPRSKRR